MCSFIPSSQVDITCLIPSLPLEHQSPGRGSWLHRLQTSWAARRGSERARIRQIPASPWTLCHSAGSDARPVCSTHSLRSADRQMWTNRRWIHVILCFLCWLELRKESAQYFQHFLRTAIVTPHRGKRHFQSSFFPHSRPFAKLYSDYRTEENYTTSNRDEFGHFGEQHDSWSNVLVRFHGLTNVMDINLKELE